MQCACAMLSSVACSALQYFFTLSQQRRDFLEKKKKEKVIENATFVLCVSTILFLKHFSF